MKNISSFYYVCEEGHLTVGDTDRKTKCPAKNFDCRLVEIKEGKKKKIDIKRKESGVCNATLIKVEAIPEELKLNEVWEWKKLRAFLIGQRMCEEFVGALQKEFTSIHDRISKLEEKENE